MAKKLPSKRKQQAAALQSLADRTGHYVEMARELQSDADQKDITKHGR